jgi:hypothetical protein
MFDPCLRWCCLLALAAAATAQQAILPDRWIQVLPGPFEGPAELRIEHVDGDARLDVLTQRSGAFGVFDWYASLSNANGEFSAPALVCHGRPVGDLNGDGRTDFARVLATSLTPPASTTFELSLSNGIGAFTVLAPQTVQYSVFTTFAALEGADLDNDGVGDLFAYGKFVPQILTVLGDGSGGLSDIVGIAHAAQTIVDVAAGDLEGDGDTDLVLCADSPHSVRVMSSIGPAWFLAPVVEDISTTPPDDMLLADFDVDGDLDAVYRFTLGNAQRLLVGDGVGGFAPAVELGALPAALHERTISDVDADGAPDLLVSLYSEFGVFRGAPGVVLSAFESLGPWRKSSILRNEDLDADGQLEWIAHSGPGLAVVEKSGPKASNVLQTTAPLSLVGLCTSDFDGDGRVDLGLGANLSATQIELRTFRWNGTGFDAVDTDLIQAQRFTGLGSADFDLDGRADICAAVGETFWTGSMRLFTGLGGASFQPGGSAPAIGQAYGFGIADIDADGNADAVNLARIDDFGRAALQALRGNGSGGLVPGPSTAPWGQPGYWFLRLADLDLDGTLDALVPGVTKDTSFAVARGDGVGGFLPVQSYAGCPSEAIATDVLATDLDQDGRLDVVIAAFSFTPSLEGVYASLGTASPALFEAPIALFTGVSSLSLTSADLDRDGAVELLAARGTAISIAKGSGLSWSVIGAASPEGNLLRVQPVELDGNASLDVLALGTQPGIFWVSLLPNLLALPQGLAPYGTGTPSCAGKITGVANLAPKVGESQFKLSWTNAPANSTALVGIAFVPDVAGTDVFGVGVNIHIGLLGPVLAYTIASDASGAAKLAFPVPNAPALAGFQAFAQALFIEPAWQSCSPSPLPWSSSTGLQVTVLP